jgi:hypothetical protein
LEKEKAVNGFDKPREIRAVLEALKHEKRSHIYNERHLAEIERQEALFTAELKRMEAEGIEDEPAPGHTPWSMTGWVGSIDHQFPPSMRRE